MVELVARADVPLAVGDAVLVEAVRGQVARVSRAPRELISEPAALGRRARSRACEPRVTGDSGAPCKDTP